jgi:NAD(P)H dehydrogenase (quinone)
MIGALKASAAWGRKDNGAGGTATGKEGKTRGTGKYSTEKAFVAVRPRKEERETFHGSAQILRDTEERQKKMKIGIIVHSYTGNTLLVAQKLMETFQEAGHEAEVLRVVVKDENPNKPDGLVMESAPDPTPYDLVIFGAPVRAFTLTPGMTKYLSGIPALPGKRVGCYVTKQLPQMWTGGNRALRQMKKWIAGHGGNVLAAEAVFWGGKDRDAQIDRVAANMRRIAQEGKA